MTVLDSHLVDCMNCLVSPSVQSLEIELASPDLQVARIRGITHAVRSRNANDRIIAGWTLCMMEFRRDVDVDVACTGEGWAIPIGY